MSLPWGQNCARLRFSHIRWGTLSLYPEKAACVLTSPRMQVPQSPPGSHCFLDSSFQSLPTNAANSQTIYLQPKPSSIASNKYVAPSHWYLYLRFHLQNLSQVHPITCKSISLSLRWCPHPTPRHLRPSSMPVLTSPSASHGPNLLQFWPHVHPCHPSPQSSAP